MTISLPSKDGPGTFENRKRRNCDRSCGYWAHDMDDAFCTHPKSFEVSPTFGLSTNAMGREGYCPTPSLPLWEDGSETERERLT